MKLLPAQRQNLMFSATYSDDIRELAGRILRNPVNIEVSPRNATADKVDQQVYRVSKDHKRHLLAHLINDGNWHQVLVFTRTKHGANRLAQQLESGGIASAAIHGNKSQGARVRALADFKANKIVALVATEVAARGLDIKELPHVVNYELPNVPEDYVHRIGRTARAGESGHAVSLVSPDEGPLLKDIERMLKRVLPVTGLPQFEIVAASCCADRRPADGRRWWPTRWRRSAVTVVDATAVASAAVDGTAVAVAAVVNTGGNGAVNPARTGGRQQAADGNRGGECRRSQPQARMVRLVHGQQLTGTPRRRRNPRSPGPSTSAPHGGGHGRPGQQPRRFGGGGGGSRQASYAPAAVAAGGRR